MQDWGELTEEWSLQQFEAVEVQTLEETVGRYHKLVMRLERGLPSNKVVPILRHKVFDLKDTLPVILNLRNPLLKQRHWDKVEGEMNCKVRANSLNPKPYTLNPKLHLDSGEKH